MWPFSRLSRTSDPRLRDLAHRLDDLADDQRHLERRFARLQGQMTGGIRYERDEADEEELDQEELQLVDEHALGAERRFGKVGS